ncbi:MAG: hypothetical protein V1781_05735 [Bacteroidota bacterium]
MWQSVDNIIREYEKSDLRKTLNLEEHIAIIHHSSAIEGASLTLIETQLLLQENITAKGKSMEHHLMVQDHNDALKFVIESAKKMFRLQEILFNR